jgi:hypothetical protein
MRNLNIDAGSMRASHISDDMIEAEARNAAALGAEHNRMR